MLPRLSPSRLRPIPIVVASFFILVLLLLLWPGVIGGQTLVPWDYLSGQPRNPLTSDLVLQNYPWKELANESFAQGTLPLWNPYIFTGVPFLAAAQSGSLYPFGVPLFFLVPLQLAYTWFFGIHLFIGALGAYGYLRIIGTERWGSLFGGTVFCLAGFLVVNPQWPQAVGAAVWLPALLAAIELVLRRRGWGRLIPAFAAAIVVAMQWLAGHPELSVYLLSSTGAYCLARLLTSWHNGPWVDGKGGAHAPHNLWAAGLCLGAVIAGTLLAAVQLVPFVEVVSQNHRAGVGSFDEVRSWALPAEQIIAFLLPDFFGNPAHVAAPYWSPKNYVESAAYVGVLPLLLLVPAWRLRRDFWTVFFSAWAIFSLLMAFGTPLYALFYFGLPGFDQLHTPFRWVFPYSFSVVVVAARGLDALLAPSGKATARWIGGAALIAGLVAVALGPAMLQGFYGRSAAARGAFTTVEAFLQYETGNLLAFGVLLTLGGAALLLWSAAHNSSEGGREARSAAGKPHSVEGGGANDRCVNLGSGAQPQCHRLSGRASRVAWAGFIAPPLFIAIVVVDLLRFGWGFLQFQDPQPEAEPPPVIARLRQDPEPFRITTFGEGKLVPPNTGMLARIQDVGGYDTIIPRAYVGFWRRMEEPAGLRYSQIDRLADPRSLDSPSLDLMNVKYVLTQEPLDNPRFQRVYRTGQASAERVQTGRGEILVYRNRHVLPRAYAVIEDGPLVPAQITGYGANQVVVSVSTPREGTLVLADAYAPGWGARDGAGGTLPVLRAGGLFRAVPLPAGDHTITFTYSPDSLKLGLYLSFLGALLCAVALGALAWRRLGYRFAEGSVAQRVLKNALTPMAATVVARAVDLGFAVFMLRVLGPVEYGGYAFAVGLIGYFAIFTDFGLGTLLTREVARRGEQGQRYVATIIGVRLMLCLVAAPVLGAAVWAYHTFLELSGGAALAALLLMAALGPSSVAGALSALFSAHERMEYPAGVVVLTSLAKAFLGVAALLLGWGVVGLGVISVATSALTALIFWGLITRYFFPPRITFDWRSGISMLGTAVPLVLNNLLNTLFFRVDVLLLQAIKGAEAVGIYSTAYKFVDGLLIIPSAFTLALFPLMSRQAETAPKDLARLYTRGLRALLLLALPAAVGITVVAEQLVVALFGEPFRTAGGVLQVLVWFLPFSYVNGLTQYVLIALNQQRFITFAFAIGAAFNLTANLLVLPAYGPHGAAAVTVASEVVLMGPFLVAVVQRLGMPQIGALALRAGAAAAAMGALLTAAGAWPLWALAPAGAGVYLAGLWLLRALTPEDTALLTRLVRPLRPDTSVASHS